MLDVKVTNPQTGVELMLSTQGFNCLDMTDSTAEINHTIVESSIMGNSIPVSKESVARVYLELEYIAQSKFEYLEKERMLRSIFATKEKLTLSRMESELSGYAFEKPNEPPQSKMATMQNVMNWDVVLESGLDISRDGLRMVCKITFITVGVPYGYRDKIDFSRRYNYAVSTRPEGETPLPTGFRFTVKYDGTRPIDNPNFGMVFRCVIHTDTGKVINHISIKNTTTGDTLTVQNPAGKDKSFGLNYDGYNYTEWNNPAKSLLEFTNLGTIGLAVGDNVFEITSASMHSLPSDTKANMDFQLSYPLWFY